LDAKFRFDDNAEFRQKELFDLRNWTQDEKEVDASKFNLNYIALNCIYSKSIRLNKNILLNIFIYFKQVLLVVW
jgi:hypothetical protein